MTSAFVSDLPSVENIPQLVSRMTVREKLGQLTQVFSGRHHKEVGVENYFEAARKGEIGAFIWALPDVAMRNRIQLEAVEGSRLGIPLIFGMDIIHGARTVFPIAPGLACAFDPDLFEKIQTVAARESAAEGIDWIFAPMCDLARDPRWGRVAETCGEDPYLSSLCNAAQVRGIQGRNPSDPERVAACLKHFVGYSAVTGGRDYSETEISEWVLRNAHLPAFEAGVREGALTIMSAFNAVDGVPAVAFRKTLTDVLRGEWRFPGFVVSDWNAVQETIAWGYAADRADAALRSISAGNDMDMLSGCYLETLEAEISAGRLKIEVVDQAVQRVLFVKKAVGLFDRPYVDEFGPADTEPRPEDRALARECVAKSAVLLTNDGVLPLSRNLSNIALIGPFGDDRKEMLGCWSERGRADDVVTLAGALKREFGEGPVSVIKGCASLAEPRTKTLQDGSVVRDEDAPLEDSEWQVEEALRAAGEADVILMAVGEPRGWTGENSVRACLGLTGRQQELFDAVAKLGKPIVTVVFCGRPLILPSIWKKSAAVIYAWQPGIEAGNGLVDLLSGRRAPEGRLSMSILRDVAQAPLCYNHARTGRPGLGLYREAGLQDAAFWFGYGLTYTTFVYSSVSIESRGQGAPAEAVVTITNTGERAGSEVAQLYISQLACTDGARPIQELRGFKRVHLEPGESAEVRFTLTREILGYVDRKGRTRVDDGKYEVWISPRSHFGSPAKYSFSNQL